MKSLEIIDAGASINMEEIMRFEELNEFVLPAYLRDFFLKYNGAETKEAVYKEKYIVNNFLPLKKGRNASVEQILPAVRSLEEGINRSDLIPFAIDPGGRPFYVSIAGEDEGAVFFDRMGLGYKVQVVRIADSFSAFINELI